MESIKKHHLLLSEAKQAANNLQIGEAPLYGQTELDLFQMAGGAVTQAVFLHPLLGKAD